MFGPVDLSSSSFGLVDLSPDGPVNLQSRGPAKVLHKQVKLPHKYY